MARAKQAFHAHFEGMARSRPCVQQENYGMDWRSPCVQQTNYGMDWRSPCAQQAPRRGNEHPAQGKRAKRCDTLGFERWGPIRPNGAKAGTGARLSPHDALYATNTRFRALPLSPPVAAFAPLGRIGSPSASPRVSLAALACPGLGAYYPFGVLVVRSKRATMGVNAAAVARMKHIRDARNAQQWA